MEMLDATVPPEDGKSTREKEIIAELRELDPIAYDRKRKESAEELGCSVTALDKAVNLERTATGEAEAQGRGIELYEPAPWEDPVDGASVLGDALRMIERHMVIRQEDGIAAVLWAAHTFVYRIFPHTPRLLITAPDAECGKTLLMNHLVGNIIPRPCKVENMTLAPFFRLAESHKPVFLVDELDLLINQEPEWLAAVNNGWEPHGGVIRCVGDDNEVRIFSTHTPIAFAGINLEKKLPPTTISRSVVVSLDRAADDELSDDDRYNAKVHLAGLKDIGRKLARWCRDNREKIHRTEPNLPPKVRNRIADKWGPLFAIAQVAGGDWPTLAKKALFGQVDLSEPSKAIQLLMDIREVMKPGEPSISTKDLIGRLSRLEESPWADYNFKERDQDRRCITDRQISGLLKRYKIHSKNVRIGATVSKSFERGALQNAWKRYLPLNTPEKSATPLQANDFNELRVQQSATRESRVADKSSPKSLNNKKCSGVADNSGGPKGKAVYHGLSMANLEAEAHADEWAEIKNNPEALEAFARALTASRK